MHHWIHRSPHLQPNAPPLSTGIANGCVFCKAREDILPNVGQRILFLCSGDAGQVGVRVDDHSYHLSSDQFAVKMDYESRGYERTVTRYLDLFIVEPFDETPAWMIPFSIEDALAVHEAVLRTIDKKLNEGYETLDKIIFPIVSSCWWQRLPITGAELWPMLAAHGFPATDQTEFSRLYEFGRELLTRNHGRRPIKGKRMFPLSKGRYLSKNSRKQWIEFFGHD